LGSNPEAQLVGQQWVALDKKDLVVVGQDQRVRLASRAVGLEEQDLAAVGVGQLVIADNEDGRFVCRAKGSSQPVVIAKIHDAGYRQTSDGMVEWKRLDPIPFQPLAQPEHQTVTLIQGLVVASHSRQGTVRPAWGIVALRGQLLSQGVKAIL
jgi:hypothetical protein